jgi:hypothetical protein
VPNSVRTESPVTAPISPPVVIEFSSRRTNKTLDTFFVPDARERRSHRAQALLRLVVTAVNRLGAWTSRARSGRAIAGDVDARAAGKTS